MEVNIDLLGLVLVIVNTKFVVMSRGVLPLSARLDSQKLHEAVDFNLRVLSTESLVVAESSVLERSGRDDILRRPLLLVAIVAVVFATVVVATLFVTFFSILVVVIILFTAFLC